MPIEEKQKIFNIVRRTKIRAEKQNLIKFRKKSNFCFVISLIFIKYEKMIKFIINGRKP
jgi:hypothetical protein